MKQIVKQVPVTALEAGLYVFAMHSGSAFLKGHIVVRGPKAAPIGSWSYPPDSETWYWAEPQADSSPPSFVLELTLMRKPDDAELINAISEVRANEQEVGTVPMVPTWAPGAPLPAKPIVVTLTEVLQGPGSYGDLYKHVSFLMPLDAGPLLPTFYTDIPGLYSIFGGDPTKGAPVEEGTIAIMKSAPAGEAGFPDPSTWLWCGRDPS